MRRLLWLLAPLLAALALWLLGRAPGAYAIERECGRYQEERRRKTLALQAEITRLETDFPRRERVVNLRGRLQDVALDVSERRMRGWSVLLIPSGARRPPPEDYLVFGKLQPAAREDPPLLQGPVEIWIAPRGLLARLIHSLGVSP